MNIIHPQICQEIFDGKIVDLVFRIDIFDGKLFELKYAVEIFDGIIFDCKNWPLPGSTPQCEVRWNQKTWELLSFNMICRVVGGSSFGFGRTCLIARVETPQSKNIKLIQVGFPRNHKM